MIIFWFDEVRKLKSNTPEYSGNCVGIFFRSSSNNKRSTFRRERYDRWIFFLTEVWRQNFKLSISIDTGYRVGRSEIDTKCFTATHLDTKVLWFLRRSFSGGVSSSTIFSFKNHKAFIIQYAIALLTFNFSSRKGRMNKQEN